MRLLSELRRRNVLRMAALYIVAAWLIMQVAEVVIDLAHLPDWVGPAILGLLAVGFPIALIFSWFYELTPEGLALEKDIDRAESITHITGRRMDFIVISLLSAAVLLFAWHTWWPSTPTDKSIAVMAFENMSDDPEQVYFSDGISEELLNALAQVPELRVISRNSSFSFRDKDVDTPTVAKQLNVAHVLEGSVRKMGDRVRITVQLIDASTDSHLWSNSYDRDLDDIFAVQEELSVAIVGALKERLGLPIEAESRLSTTANIEAHDAYLRGRYLVVQRTQASIEGAVREFKKAVELDPNYALAHAELAIATLMCAWYGDPTVTEAISMAIPHAEQAMALDPTIAEAHAAAGFILRRQDRSEQALTHYQRAVEINPNYAIAYNWIGITFSRLGRYEENFAAIETALRLDPLSIPTHYNYILGLIIRNRLNEADRELEELAAISPSTAAELRGYRMSLGGNWANSILGILDSLRIGPQRLSSWGMLSMQLAAIGLEKEALAISESKSRFVRSILRRHTDAVTFAEARLAEDPTNFRARRNLGMALASAGDYERARPILEDVWERSGRRVTTEGLFYTDCAAALIAIRRDAGEEAEVGELVAAIRDNVRRYREADITRGGWYLRHVDYEEGLAAYLAGDSERGLALIAKVVEDGFFIMPNEAYLQLLYDDPGYAPIRALQEAMQVRERNRFLSVVCTNNPYADIWQPAEGTCEQFAAASGT